MRQYQVIEPNQLMWCKVDTKNGAFGITHTEHAGTLASPNMALADINLEKADPSFLETLFRVQSFADYITHLSSGTTNRKYLTPPELLKQVMLPDWEPEQQRTFVSKLRQIEECGLVRELTHQQSLIAKLKQAILQEAIQGKLTADWRAAHPDVEPASQLLQRIQAEKARLIAAKKLRPEKPLPKIIPSEIPFEIPKGWEWCRLGIIAEEITKGSSPTWQGIRYVDESADGILFVTSKNVGNGEMLFEKMSFVEARFNEIEPRSILQKNDILTNLVGASIARTALFDLDCVANINQAVALIRIAEGYINKALLVAYMNSAAGVAYMLEQQFAPGRANLSLTDMAKMLVPLPPLAEQAAIVERVEALMTTCRALEAEIEHARTHAAHLLQAVLKEAFAPATGHSSAGSASPGLASA
jgi:type I restriction enzyme S subunit